MKINGKFLYHGAALSQIAEHDSFKALNKADAKYGHYLVNTDRRMLTKHSEKGEPWQFTFQPDDLQTLAGDIAAGFATFLVLVCADETVCLLDKSEFTQLIDLNATRQQWIRVAVPKASMRLSGSTGNLSHAIKHNGFPKRVFE